MVVFVFAFSLIGQLASNYLSGNASYWEQNRWISGLALLVAATTSWYVGRLFATSKGRVVIDKETGQEVTLRRNHSSFFIKMHY